MDSCRAVLDGLCTPWHDNGNDDYDNDDLDDDGNEDDDNNDDVFL